MKLDWIGLDWIGWIAKGVETEGQGQGKGKGGAQKGERGEQWSAPLFLCTKGGEGETASGESG